MLFLMLNFFKDGKNPSETYESLLIHWPEFSPSLRTIYRRFEDFNSGNFKLEDSKRSGRPVNPTKDENVRKIEKLIEENPKISLRELAE
jgi:hypothetical protein